MRTNKLLFASAALMLATATMFLGGCKKNQAFKDEDGQASEDNRTIMSENDAAVNDMNDVVGQESKMRGRSSGPNDVYDAKGITGTICGLTIDTVNLHLGSITLNYDGTTCNNKNRTGSIKLTIKDYASGKRWRHKGCVLQADFIAYKVTRASDGKSIQLDGTQYLTNESGGSWWELLILKTQTNIATTTSANNLKVTFSDNKTATYNINRRFTYTFPVSILTCTGEGIGSSNGLSNLENYGKTRDGADFTSQVVTPIIWNLTCGAWAPIQGEVNVKVQSKSFDLKGTFGVDTDGNPVTVGPNACPYGWKVEWTHKNKTKKKIMGYK